MGYSVSPTSKPHALNLKCVRRITPTGNPDYYAFGNGVLINNDTVFYAAKVGPSHYLDGGDIFGMTYSVSSGIWSSPVVIATDGTNYYSGVSIGKVGNRLYIQIAKYTVSGGVDTFYTIGYIRSADLTTNPNLLDPASWSSFSSFPAPTYERYEAYGRIQPSETPGKYFAPWFEHKSGGTDPWRINIRKTTDSGETWANIQVYDGTSKFGEPYLVHTGGTTWLIFARSNESSPNAKLRIFSSTDDCETWANVGYANISDGTGQCNASAVYYNSLIHIIFQDRGTGKIRISKDNTRQQCLDLNLNAATDYFTNNSSDSLNGVGYPDILLLEDSDNVLLTWAKETSTTECHIIGTRDKISTI